MSERFLVESAVVNASIVWILPFLKGVPPSEAGRDFSKSSVLPARRLAGGEDSDHLLYKRRNKQPPSFSHGLFSYALFMLG